MSLMKEEHTITTKGSDVEILSHYHLPHINLDTTAVTNVHNHSFLQSKQKADSKQNYCQVLNRYVVCMWVGGGVFL